jgi:hypothetical protein
MNFPYLETDPEKLLTKEYPLDKDLTIEDLTEVFVIVYTIEVKGRDPEEVYTFTTDFDQAYKRLKILPNGSGFLKRLFTDSDELIRLAKEGTKPKVTDLSERLQGVSFDEVHPVEE